jgi:hypothetical protein
LFWFNTLQYKILFILIKKIVSHRNRWVSILLSSLFLFNTISCALKRGLLNKKYICLLLTRMSQIWLFRKSVRWESHETWNKHTKILICSCEQIQFHQNAHILRPVRQLWASLPYEVHPNNWYDIRHFKIITFLDETCHFIVNGLFLRREVRHYLTTLNI